MKGRGLQCQIVARCVGGAQNDLAQPGHGKEHAAIGGAWHQHRVGPRQEAAVDHQVHALAGCHHGRSGGGVGLAVHVTHSVHPHTRGVDDAARLQREGLARLGASRLHAVHLALVAQQTRGHYAVGQHSATSGSAAHQGDGQTRVVKLAVPVLHAADQALGRQARRHLQGLGTAQEFCAAQTAPTGKQVIGLQTGAVKSALPPAVAGHDKGQGLGQMRRVGQHGAALLQRFTHQGHVALREVTHTAMRELGGA